jgi:hypothetical protein
MTEHQRETEFLQHCIRYDETPARRVLEDKITQIQRDERCVRRAIWLMALLLAATLASFGYAAILVETFRQSTSHLIVTGAASMICLVVFMGLRIVYRAKLDQRREECRQLVVSLLESRLGKPAAVSPSGIVHDPGNVPPTTKVAVSATEMDLSRAQ